MPNPATVIANLAGHLNKPTTMLAVQQRLHELDEPITASALAKDLGLIRHEVSTALCRLVGKGLAVRKRRLIAFPVWKTYATSARPRTLRQARKVWHYTILQERD